MIEGYTELYKYILYFIFKEHCTDYFLKVEGASFYMYNADQFSSWWLDLSEFNWIQKQDNTIIMDLI